MNILVSEIDEILKVSAKPMTAQEIATQLGVSKQTIFNHIATCIHKGLVIDTGQKRGQAKLFATSDSSVANAVMIKWGDEREALKDLFVRWSRELPKDPSSARFARSVLLIFKLAGAFADDSDNSEKSFIEKASDLKEHRSWFLRYADHLESIAQACRMIASVQDLWNPKDLVNRLIIRDPDITPARIRSAFDKPQD